jgi:hypothetical protein
MPLRSSGIGLSSFGEIGCAAALDPDRRGYLLLGTIPVPITPHSPIELSKSGRPSTRNAKVQGIDDAPDLFLVSTRDFPSSRSIIICLSS